jgi:hypothetical protein
LAKNRILVGFVGEVRGRMDEKGRDLRVFLMIQEASSRRYGDFFSMCYRPDLNFENGNFSLVGGWGCRCPLPATVRRATLAALL